MRNYNSSASLAHEFMCRDKLFRGIVEIDDMCVCVCVCLCKASIQLFRVDSISTPCSVEKDGKDKKKPAAVILNSSSPSEPMKLVTAVMMDGPSETMEPTESMVSTIVTTCRF